jgi:hypothetical protein
MRGHRQDVTDRDAVAKLVRGEISDADDAGILLDRRIGFDPPDALLRAELKFPVPAPRVAGENSC